MSDRDDYEYVDDEDYYDEDEDDDDDEQLGGDWRSRLNNQNNLPGRDRSSGVLGGSGSSARSGSVYGKSDSSKLPGARGGKSSSRSTYGGGASGRDSIRDRINRPSGDTAPLRGNSGSSSSGSSDWRSRIGSGDKTTAGSTGGGSKTTNSSSDWRSRVSGDNKSSGSSSKSNDSKNDWRSQLGGSGSDNKKGNQQSASSRIKANPKDDKKTSTTKDDSGGGGLRNRFGRGGGNDKKANDKKASTSKDDSGGGGLRNRFGRGGGDDKKADNNKASAKTTATKKDDSGGGGLRNRFGRGGGDDKKAGNNKASAKTTAAKKDDKKSDGDGGNAVAASIGGALGGFRNRFGGSGGDDKKADDKDNSKFSNSAKGSKAGGGKQSKLGASRGGKSGGKDTTKGNKATDKPAEGGGVFGNLFSRARGSDAEEDKKTATKKARTSKAPKVESDEWFDLDRKLDLVGVGLVFGAILLFFSALSQEQAAISFVHNFIGQLFGWGALAVPATMFAVGAWLIIRHFGEDAPTVDPLRLAGIVIGFIGVLTLFQYWESFNYIEAIPVAQEARLAECSTEFQDSCTQDLRNLAECDVSITTGCLEGLVKYSYEESAGGGIVGGWLYLTLVSNLTEIGGFVVVAMVLTFALMMMTRLSMAEIAIVFIGVGRSLRTSMAQNAARRRAQKLREEQQKAIAAEAASVSVSKPAPAQLPGFQATNALPEPSGDTDTPIPIEERDILIRRGGQAFSSTELQQEPVLLGTTAQAQPVEKQGRFRLFGRNKQQDQPQPQDQPNPATRAVVATAGAGLMGRLFSRGDNNNPQPQPTQQLPQGQPVQQPIAQQVNNMPAGGNIQQPQTQPMQQPIAQPQQPIAQTASGQPVQAQPVQPTQPQVQPTQQPQAQPQQPVAQGGDGMTRQDRLNAIRQGQTAPQAQPTQQAPVASNGGNGNGSNGNDYNPFGRPDDIPTHESENLPGQQFSSTTPITTQSAPQPRINTPQDNVQKPVSSGPVNQSRIRINWKLPDYRTLLSSGSEQEFDREHLLNQARIIEETLGSFGAPGRVVEVNTGPVITQFGVEPDYLTSRSGKKSRVKVSAIAQLDKDLQLALGAKSIRVEAPVPGKGYVGIEVPNTEASLVSLRDVMESEDFQKIKSPLGIALGMSVDGSPISADLTQMPHLLIAGTTGSGKSVCVNAIINSVIATNSPEEVKFIMVDPKRVELTGYNGLPHLIAPVVVELERIVGVLKWVTREMDERYKKFSNMGARNIIDYNKHRDENLEPMPYIIVIIDELADLMMLAPEETERTITRIAALARATGIHLVIATQRPSVDVVTGLIKANFPARIAFAVAGGVDSRVILDQPGAERLLGKGDMLYLSGDSPAPLRLQGVFVSDMEINNITRYWKAQSVGVETVKPISVLTTPVKTESSQSVAPVGERVKQAAFWDAGDSNSEPNDPNKLAIEDQTGNPDPQEDELYETAVQMVRRLDKASISLLQRRLRIGYTRAARLIDMMEERGVVGPAKEGSSKPRDVIPE